MSISGESFSANGGKQPQQEELVPELKAMQQQLGEEIGIEDWIAAVGSPQLAIGYIYLFWPEFKEHQGGIFLEAHFTERSFQEWQVIFGDRITEVEQHMNHTALTDLFGQAHEEGNITPAQLRFIGKRLRAIWGAKLAADFPTKHCVVEFNEGEALADYHLIFYQQK
jgi:hypothetical protein